MLFLHAIRYDVRGFFILTFAYRSTLLRQVRFFGKNMGSNHLEVACGTGTLLSMTLHWRRRHKLPTVHTIGVDYAERMLEGAKHRFKDEIEQKSMEFQRADAAKMDSFADESFDTVNIANSIHCLPQIKQSLEEMFRVLKKGGTLAGNVLLHPRGRSGPFKYIANRINTWGIERGILISPHSESHIRELLLEVGFQIVSVEVSGNCMEFLGRRPLLEVEIPNSEV